MALKAPGVLGLASPRIRLVAGGNGGDPVLLGVADASGNAFLRRSFGGARASRPNGSNGAVPARRRRAGEAWSAWTAFRGPGTLLSELCSRAVVV
jgi:hypothetical protein